MRIDKQLIKDKRIQTQPINFSFGIYNVDGTKSEDVIRVALLEVKINGYKKQLEALVIDLNEMDMFLGYDQFVKYNLEVNWKDSLQDVQNHAR